MQRKTQEEIDEFRAALVWKINLHSLALELLDEAAAGDEFALSILGRCGLVAAPRLVSSGLSPEVN